MIGLTLVSSLDYVYSLGLNVTPTLAYSHLSRFPPVTARLEEVVDIFKANPLQIRLRLGLDEFFRNGDHGIRTWKRRILAS